MKLDDFKKGDIIVYYSNSDDDLCISRIHEITPDSTMVGDLYSSVEESCFDDTYDFYYLNNHISLVLFEHIKEYDITDNLIEELKLKYCEYLI